MGITSVVRTPSFLPQHRIKCLYTTFQPLLPESLETAMETVLTNSFAEFNGEYFEQIKGTAMGTPCAPSLATLKVGREEERLFRRRKKNKLHLSFFT
jgi:hypothetical protein